MVCQQVVLGFDDGVSSASECESHRCTLNYENHEKALKNVTIYVKVCNNWKFNQYEHMKKYAKVCQQ